MIKCFNISDLVVPKGVVGVVVVVVVVGVVVGRLVAVSTVPPTKTKPGWQV